MLFHSTTVVLNPQPHTLFSPFPFFLSTPIPRKLLSLQTLNFPTHSNLFYSQHDFQQHVLGDSLIFEDGVFEDPILQNNINSYNLTKPKRKKKKRNVAPPQIVAENLVPEKWRQIQDEINIAKKESRKIAQEMELDSKVDKKRRGLIPLKDLNMDEYKAYKEAKLAQLKPLVLDNPSRFPVKEEDFVEKEEDSDDDDDDDDEFGGTERVKPKNPRWAVYGRSLEDVSEFLNSEYYDPHANKNSQGRQKLFTKEENVLLKRGIPDLASASSDKWLPLHTLAACGEFYLVDSLMKHNVDINAVDKDGLTALHKAIIGKNQAITNYLLINSANPFVKDKDRATLMHYAVQTASSQTIKILLLYNVDINRPDNDGWTPLHLAVQTQRTDLVRLLLIKGANKTLKNKDGLTPLDLCLYLGQCLRTYELIKLLKQQPKLKSNFITNKEK
ncbi:PREDICTED: ankyrin repeat domain-containing protein, chloroplastic-like isoform X2 [Lupinus angustifolius]|uniref:ankyrin repeat domain-containing protein, chloroplastic-like isoform X2 n=1 Tax=Lupinus angustifolius TaxID=3871 RepID=UPI00092F3B29|nr:PREDICTED: ankyrin repeat domain-containing protein, chloroplastic-like isoform X2 [Lupinus angustifolius]